MKKMTEKQFKSWLKRTGWKFGGDPYDSGNSRWYAYKSFPDWSDCRCNDKPPSVTIKYYELQMKENLYRTCVIGFAAEGIEGHWVSFKYYCVSPEECKKSLDEFVTRLRWAWESVLD